MFAKTFRNRLQLSVNFLSTFLRLRILNEF